MISALTSVSGFLEPNPQYTVLPPSWMLEVRVLGPEKKERNDPKRTCTLNPRFEWWSTRSYEQEERWRRLYPMRIEDRHLLHQQEKWFGFCHWSLSQSTSKGWVRKRWTGWLIEAKYTCSEPVGISDETVTVWPLPLKVIARGAPWLDGIWLRMV